MKRVLIAAGGTGGHVFPALAVAHLLDERRVAVYWLGVKGGLEERYVPSSFSLEFIPMKALRGQRWLRRFWVSGRLLLAVIQSYRYIRRLRPDVVLGMGGYVSAPAGIAAWLARVPLIIHEQNAVAGLANRCLAILAKTVLQAFPQTFSKRWCAKTVGNPIRKALLTLPPPRERLVGREGPLRLLVLGGSQGARDINQCVLDTLGIYPEKEALLVWHQTGASDYERIKKAYAGCPVEVKINAFIEEMAHAYHWADLVIARAGALTVSEIAVVGIGAILVPYPFAVDDHQRHNSRSLERRGAAIVMLQESFTQERLTALLQHFVRHRDRLLVMAECARSAAEPDATDKVAAACLRWVSGVST